MFYPWRYLGQELLYTAANKWWCDLCFEMQVRWRCSSAVLIVGRQWGKNFLHFCSCFWIYDNLQVWLKYKETHYHSTYLTNLRPQRTSFSRSSRWNGSLNQIFFIYIFYIFLTYFFCIFIVLYFSPRKVDTDYSFSP